MGYRAEWVSHEGAVAVHSEIALAAFDREIPPKILRLLVAGIGEGGAVEIWRKVLPEGSEVTALDRDPACRDLPGIDPIICDLRDKAAVREALAGRWFDVIIDATGSMSPHTWPFLAPGGLLLYETYDPGVIMPLALDIALEAPSWLPIEEIMRLDLYRDIAVLEKRPPIVVPPLRVMTGNFADRAGEDALQRAGIRRVIAE